MLTGQAAFQGEDVTEILAAVVKSGVNFDLLPANIHPRVREAITRCLQKDLNDRYRDIGDAQFEIRQVLADPSGIFVQPVTAAKPRKKLQVGISWIAAALILGLIVAVVAVWKLKPLEPRHIVSFDYHLPEGQEFNYEIFADHTLAVSHDVIQFIYSTRNGLYLRSENELQAQIIPGTEDNPQSPFFSPDDQSAGLQHKGTKPLFDCAVEMV
jgi:hypothetical protein